MTRRERMENRITRRLEWAEKAESRSMTEIKKSNSLVENIPFGQPILVGHHSERRHRRTIERAQNAASRSVAESKLAELHTSKAENLEAALNSTIFSDDDNALDALQARIAEHEAERERMKTVNALYRKKDVAGLAALGLDYDEMHTRLESPNNPSWCKKPYAPFELSNLGARITSDKKRMQAIKAQQARHDAAAQTTGGILIKQSAGCTLYSDVIFAEKPERSVLNDLKSAGFQWCGGRWWGKTSDIPESVTSLANGTT